MCPWSALRPSGAMYSNSAKTFKHFASLPLTTKQALEKKERKKERKEEKMKD
jgi:hypothetical protein